MTAIEHFDRALAIKPDFEDAHHREDLHARLSAGVDFAALQAARKYWWDAIGAKIAAAAI